MTHTYQVEGMTCNACKDSVEKQVEGLSEIKEVKVDLEKGKAEVTMNQPIKISKIQDALSEKYTLSEIENKPAPTPPTSVEMEAKKSKWEQLKPLFLVLGYIAVASILMHYQDWNMQEVMLDFMGLFFIVFSFFKMLDLQGFPDSFRMYDPLAKRIPIYAKIYPFLETVLGIMFLMRIGILTAIILTIIILGITTIGVTRSLLDKRSIRCACLGTALKLPMTEATFIENAIMLVMSITLLINQI